ncbi:plakophilin-3a [Electrophorus electricus]|uniref:plakophilin-3a n=1 Tax=Electrophorus electricus TaxID=8005 RepID=UPI0015D0668E|nr:plakophilin-3a [Electrophorus electricus]
MSVTSENVFMSALQPNSAVTTYAVPTELHLGHAGSLSADSARAKRVQQQVALRLAEKSTLPRQNGSTSQYATSDYGGSSTMTKYQTYNPSFTSKSYINSTTRPLMAQRASQQSSGYSAGYSSRSAMDFTPRAQMSRGATAGMMYNHEEMTGMGGISGMTGMSGMGGGYQSNQSHQHHITAMRSTTSRPGPDLDSASMRSLRMQSMPQQPMSMAPWMMQDGSEGSLVSDQDAAVMRQEAAASMSNGYSYTCPRPAAYSSSNNFSGGTSLVQTSMTLPAMRRTLSSTLSRGGSAGVNVDEETYVRQSYKGPSQRTINRITQRQVRNSMSGGTIQGGGGGGGYMVTGGFSQGSMGMGRLSRAASMRSMMSVGKGKDVFDGQDLTGSMGNLTGLQSLDMPTALSYLASSEEDLQVLGAAYIQHECYSHNEAKKEVKHMNGIGPLVNLFTSINPEVQRYATGAARNLIYENMENKVALIEAGGIPKMVEALQGSDDELHKNITGILWNLSSKDNLKEKLARETLPRLTEQVLIPLSGTGEREIIDHSPSEADIFFNTTGCLRNLSSVNEKTREQMRETNGLVKALVGYIDNCLQDSRVEEKGVENAMCVLRNLSYQLYSEIPPSVQMRLEGPNRAQASSRGDAIGCFTPQSKKAKDAQHQDLSTFTEVAREPTGIEWLWHPKVVGLYNRILQRCETNSTTREAAAGALQNITAGDKRWAAILSRVALEQERMLPVILDHLRASNDLEMRSLTGFLRNLSRHAKDKNDMATKVVSNLVAKLPSDGLQKEPSSDVVVNICGALNNLVTSSELAARDITYFDGLPKLVGIKTSHDSSSIKIKAAKAASTVLNNMFQYKKLHKEYKKKGFQRQDFIDINI